MSFRAVELDGEMGIRGEEGVIDKDENSSRRRNDVMQKRGQQSEKRLLKCEQKTEKRCSSELESICG